MIGIFVLIIAQWSHSFQTQLGPRPGSRFWQSYRVAWINSFLLNQNNVVLVKKKKKQKSTGSPSHAGFFLSLFFFNSAWLQFRVPVRPTGPGRVSKLWMEQCMPIYIYEILLVHHIFPTQTKEGIKTRHICNNNKEKCW
jgi:hypothetical protein